MKKYEEGVTALRSALELKPKFVPALTDLAGVLSKTEDYRQQVNTLSQLVAIFHQRRNAKKEINMLKDMIRALEKLFIKEKMASVKEECVKAYQQLLTLLESVDKASGAANMNGETRYVVVENMIRFLERDSPVHQQSAERSERLMNQYLSLFETIIDEYERLSEKQCDHVSSSLFTWFSEFLISIHLSQLFSASVDGAKVHDLVKKLSHLMEKTESQDQVASSEFFCQLSFGSAALILLLWEIDLLLKFNKRTIHRKDDSQDTELMQVASRAATMILKLSKHLAETEQQSGVSASSVFKGLAIWRAWMFVGHSLSPVRTTLRSNLELMLCHLCSELAHRTMVKTLDDLRQFTDLKQKQNSKKTTKRSGPVSIGAKVISLSIATKNAEASKAAEKKERERLWKLFLNDSFLLHLIRQRLYFHHHLPLKGQSYRGQVKLALEAGEACLNKLRNFRKVVFLEPKLGQSIEATQLFAALEVHEFHAASKYFQKLTAERTSTSMNGLSASATMMYKIEVESGGKVTAQDVQDFKSLIAMMETDASTVNSSLLLFLRMRSLSLQSRVSNADGNPSQVSLEDHRTLQNDCRNLKTIVVDSLARNDQALSDQSSSELLSFLSKLYPKLIASAKAAVSGFEADSFLWTSSFQLIEIQCLWDAGEHDRCFQNLLKLCQRDKSSAEAYLYLFRYYSVVKKDKERGWKCLKAAFQFSQPKCKKEVTLPLVRYYSALFNVEAEQKVSRSSNSSSSSAEMALALSCQEILSDILGLNTKGFNALELSNFRESYVLASVHFGQLQIYRQKLVPAKETFQKLLVVSEVPHDGDFSSSTAFLMSLLGRIALSVIYMKLDQDSSATKTLEGLERDLGELTLTDMSKGPIGTLPALHSMRCFVLARLVYLYMKQAQYSFALEAFLCLSRSVETDHKVHEEKSIQNDSYAVFLCFWKIALVDGLLENLALSGNAYHARSLLGWNASLSSSKSHDQLLALKRAQVSVNGGASHFHVLTAEGRDQAIAIPLTCLHAEPWRATNWYDIAAHLQITGSKAEPWTTVPSMRFALAAVLLDSKNYRSWQLLSTCLSEEACHAGDLKTQEHGRRQLLRQHCFIRSLELKPENNFCSWVGLCKLYFAHGDKELANLAFANAQQCAERDPVQNWMLT